MSNAHPAAVVVTAQDLPLTCPRPDTPVWNQHPRVVIDLHNGEGKCQYCGTVYHLEGDAPAGH